MLVKPAPQRQKGPANVTAQSTATLLARGQTAMLIVQLSDLHLRDDGAYPRHDPAPALRRAFDTIARMQPPPARILLTGDVIDRSAAGYAAAARLLQDAPAPLRLISGNHDRPAEFRAALGHHAPFADGHLSFVEELGPLTLVGLDSNRPDGGAGVDPARLDWLAGVLDAAQAPVLLALHHPPFATGVPRADAAPFAMAAELEALVQDSPVARVIAGHVHRGIFTTWAGVPASTAPALAHALALSFVAEAPHAHVADAPGLHLHQLTATGQLITHPFTLAESPLPEGLSGPLDAAGLARIVHS